ncbi:hypothetical protein B0T24DRAFT_674336 [Lasiosphaeria ovina]|uniref:Uncharacterized protein n=1 Tax=Lasiosphaeria ovina TaxID=92902 RepID=A0AAE0NN35_9PEZI|nr:hypothetical protein B0T24DRAFT_674336 [Lasiosphaeria ovina]
MVLHNEKPFFMIRGLKPQWFSKRKNGIIHLGIGSHVATKRALAKGDATVLLYLLTMIINPQPFQNDFDEIVSLSSLSRPAAGGDFFLADINDITAATKSGRCSSTRQSNGMVIQASRSRLCNNNFFFCPARPDGIDDLEIQALDALHAAGHEVAVPTAFRASHKHTTARYLLRLILRDQRNPAWHVPRASQPTWRELYGHADEDEVVPVLPLLFSFKASY